jgi:hypothetical protein
MTKLQMMQTNPGMMMKDPEMMEVLQALLGAFFVFITYAILAGFMCFT